MKLSCAGNSFDKLITGIVCRTNYPFGKFRQGHVGKNGILKSDILLKCGFSVGYDQLDGGG